MGKSASKLSKKDISYLKNNTSFNQKELQEWYKGFMKDCPSGQLTRTEFMKIYNHFLSIGDPTDFSNHVFDIFDADKSGTIDFKEFITALSVTSRGTVEEKLIWAFESYDVNGDGHISYDEMLKIVKAFYKMMGQTIDDPDAEDSAEKRVKKIFEQLDTNGDGEVSLDEFREGSRINPAVVSTLNLYNNLV